MIVNKEILEKVRTFGAFRYSVFKMLSLLNIEAEQHDLFIEEFDNKESRVRRYYEQGVAMGEHNVSVALMKKAEEGDVFASQQLEDLSDKRNVENLRKELFGV